MSDLDEAGGSAFDDLERWAAKARAREAVEARVRERWLRTQAEEGARLAHVLAGFVEQRSSVVVTTTAGRQLAGHLTSVGQDFVAVESAAGVSTLVALTALAWVRSAVGEPRRREPAIGPDPSWFDDDGAGTGAAGGGPGEPGTGDARGASLADVLAQAVAHRPRVAVQSESTSITGALRSVGVDVVVVQTAGEPPGLAYVRLRSIYEISFLDSG